jgi:hypothetical protein
LRTAEAGARAESAHNESCAHHYSAYYCGSKVCRIDIYQVQVNPSEKTHKKQSEHSGDCRGEKDFKYNGVIAVKDSRELSARGEAAAFKYPSEGYPDKECQQEVGVFRNLSSFGASGPIFMLFNV